MKLTRKTVPLNKHTWHPPVVEKSKHTGGTETTPGETQSCYSEDISVVGEREGGIWMGEERVIGMSGED